MKVETKDQLRDEVQKLRGQIVDLKYLARDEFTVTLNKLGRAPPPLSFDLKSSTPNIAIVILLPYL